MKITIQHYNEIASLEVPDDSPLEEFRDHLLRILHVMWLPEHVAEIMRANDWDEGFHAGKEEAETNNHQNLFQNNELLKDQKRLDWLLENKYALGSEQDLSECKHTGAKSYQLIYTRESIDREMEESK